MNFSPNTRRSGPGFGNPDSIDRVRLFKLPMAMQAEGVRLLFEMGLSMDEARARVGLSREAIDQLLGTCTPFRRGGDASVAAEGM